MWQMYFGFCSDLSLFSFAANKTCVLLMKLLSYTLMTCTLNEVLRTKISELPPLASSLRTRTSLHSRRLELVGTRKNGARACLPLARLFFLSSKYFQAPATQARHAHDTIVAKANKLLGPLKCTCPLITDVNVRRTLYLFLVKSQVRHATQVWSPNQYSLKAKNERVQKRATRIVEMS